MNRFVYSLFFALLISFSAYSQKASYFKRIFVDAEYYLLYEDYRDALPLYIEIYNIQPSNANVNYRIGLCYLNIPNEKQKSIPFFERAIKDVTESYREGYYTEQQAPREVFLNYGRALRINGDFEKSKQAFITYRSMLNENETQEKDLVKKEIESVEYALQMKENPVNVKFTSAGRNINSRFAEVFPVVSADNKIMVYTSVQQFYSAIMVSHKEDGKWNHPININTQLFADGPIRTVGLSSDGNTLLLARNDNDVYNLYISSYDSTKKSWGTMARLPKEINTRNWETYGSLSPKGDTLYFSSNRPGGQGGFDLFMSVKTATGWSEASNLGNAINSSFDEIAPTVSRDGKKLFFASNASPTIGDFDIFVSYRRNGKWTKPINLGYPMNTTDDDLFYFPIGDGSTGYISRVLPESSGENDIYFVEFEQNKENNNEDLNGNKIPIIPITQGQVNQQAHSLKEISNSFSTP
jgi:tetratricopeptide (TPR) repeat protein